DKEQQRWAVVARRWDNRSRRPRGRRRLVSSVYVVEQCWKECVARNHRTPRPPARLCHDSPQRTVVYGPAPPLLAEETTKVPPPQSPLRRRQYLRRETSVDNSPVRNSDNWI
ncbi:unnamed protein product, partial [Meganyctiphanes norvegica]